MSSRIRVCYPFTGDTLGGSHLSALALIRNLPPKTYQSLIVLFNKGKLADYLLSQDIPFVVLPNARFVAESSMPSEIFQMLSIAPRLARFLRSENISIVHTNDLRMHRTWGLSSRLAGCKFVWHQRTADDSRRNGAYSRLAYEIITISEFCRQSFTDYMAEKTRVIANPFEPPAESVNRQKEKHNLLELLGHVSGESGCAVIGFVGNMTDQKRPLVFVEAAARIIEKSDGRILFPMFGDPRPGITEEVKKRIETLGLANQVFPMGMKTPIEPWISACDLLLAPGVNEGFGRALVEAMLAGIPVIASDMGGHKEVLIHEKTGFLVPHDQPDLFAEQALALLRKPEYLHDISVNAKEYAKDNFSVENHVRQVVNLYERLLH